MVRNCIRMNGLSCQVRFDLTILLSDRYRNKPLYLSSYIVVHTAVPTYTGCYFWKGGGTNMDDKLIESKMMTPAVCAAACKTLQYVHSLLFFLKFLADTCPFLGPLVPLFWISGDVSSGFQSQSGFCLIRYFCGGECNVHSPRFTSGALTPFI